MKIRITTFDDRGREVVSRDFHNDNDSNGFEDEILYDIVDTTISALCSECGGTGKVIKGEDDNVEEVNCSLC